MQKFSKNQEEQLFDRLHEADSMMDCWALAARKVKLPSINTYLPCGEHTVLKLEKQT